MLRPRVLQGSKSAAKTNKCDSRPFRSGPGGGSWRVALEETCDKGESTIAMYNSAATASNQVKNF
jgi:hypothetical protein